MRLIFVDETEAKVNTETLMKMRTRWLRWLGQKTRCDKPYWSTLLNCNWIGWAYKVLSNNNIDKTLRIISSRTEVKEFYRQAINLATPNELIKLDSLYADEKVFS